MKLMLLVAFIIHLTVCAQNDTHNRANEHHPKVYVTKKATATTTTRKPEVIEITHELAHEETLGEEVEHMLKNMIKAVQNVPIPFVGHENDSVAEKLTDSHTTSTTSAKTSSNETFLHKTTEELKKDVEMLKSFYNELSDDVDEWIISNHHQTFKSAMIGFSVALITIILYSLLKKCCQRQSRRHLSAFAGANDSDRLLERGLKNRHFAANSDDDDM